MKKTKQNEYQLVRTFSFYNGIHSIKEKINAIDCEKNECTITSKTGLISEDIIKSLRKKDGFPLKENLGRLVQFLISLHGKAQEANYELFAFLTCVVTVRGFEGGLNRNQTESVFRLVMCKDGVSEFIRDIPFLSDTILFFRNIQREFDNAIFDTLLRSKKTGYKIVPQKIILAPRAAAFFFHEIIGHLLEYDATMVEDATYNEESVGFRIFDIDITVRENPSKLRALGVDFGTADDSGAHLEQVEIIRNGTLKSFIYSVRSDAIDHFLQNRMYCLCIDNNPEGFSADEIIANSDDAILVDNIYAGSVNLFDGMFLLMCQKGYLVENGKITCQLKNLLITDDVKSMRKKIVHVGNDAEYFIGYCTKRNQTVTVGQGSPTIVLSDMNIQLK